MTGNRWNYDALERWMRVGYERGCDPAGERREVANLHNLMSKPWARAC
jgi:hypothetical protein